MLLDKKQKLISIVIPCYNEEGNISSCVREIKEVLNKHSDTYEIICVNDGSKDNTWDKIEEVSKTYPQVKGINLMRNYGLTQAYMAGFDKSKGTYVITVAADLEIPAENLNTVIKYLDDGYDFVNTNRKGRWGKASRSFPSKIANAMISKISGGISMQDTGSGMKGFRRVIIDNLEMYGEMHRFMPSYLTILGAKMIEFDVEYQERKYGVSAYAGLGRTFKVLLDMLTLFFMVNLTKKPFKALPGRMFGALGAFISGLGGVGTIYLLILKIMGESIGSRPLFFVSILMIVVGVQMMTTGMLGELTMRTYFESNNRKTYTIRETV